ncbi:MAG: hypothetical protein Q4D04_07940 [Clostridia bacterium]|nr:hypothetical protein [Clostridia bacterium]
MTDIHCHILPCVDDGARDSDMTLRMLDAAARGGVRVLFATPHLMRANQNIAGIQRRFELMLPLARERGIELRLGFEIHYMALPDARDLSAFCMGDTNALLVELPFSAPFPNWLSYLERLSKRYRLIIAHPERYTYIQKDRALAGALRQIGCELQLSANAFLLSPLHPARRAAQAILSANKANYIATDAHTDAEYPRLLRAVIDHRHMCDPGRLLT